MQMKAIVFLAVPCCASLAAQNGATNLQPAPRDGIHLTIQRVASPARGFDGVLMTTGKPMETLHSATRVSRSFSLGTSIGLAAETPQREGWIVVELEVVRHSVVTSKVSASGEHVLGEVINDEAHVSAFK